MPTTACYRIHTVAELTGIPASTLRAWERRYGVPSPERSNAAYRLYSEDDVALLRRMKVLTDGGIAPSAAAAMLVRPEPEAPPVDAGLSALELARARLLDAVERYDVAALRQEVARACYLGRAVEVFEGVLAPTMRAIGEAWRLGRLSVAQEHLASEVLLGAARDLHGLIQVEADQPLALLACAAGEQHVLPLYGVALRFASWHVRAEILGASTPPEAVAAAVAAMRPELVGLSATAPLPEEGRGRLLDAYAAAADGRPWIMGGAGALAAREAIEARGGLICAGEASQLRELVLELVGAPPLRSRALAQAAG